MIEDRQTWQKAARMAARRGYDPLNSAPVQAEAYIDLQTVPDLDWEWTDNHQLNMGEPNWGRHG